MAAAEMCRQRTGDKLPAIANGFRTDPGTVAAPPYALKLISKKPVSGDESGSDDFEMNYAWGGFISLSLVFSLRIRCRDRLSKVSHTWSEREHI